jgi:hypothetical protein
MGAFETGLKALNLLRTLQNPGKPNFKNFLKLAGRIICINEWVQRFRVQGIVKLVLFVSLVELVVLNQTN